jgi:roadblock/LC7 domain-containing protein
MVFFTKYKGGIYSMKMNRRWMKRVCSMLMALAMIISMVPATVFAASTDTKVFLKPNDNWKVDNARFAIYCFGNGEKWVSMSDSDGDGIYEGVVPAGFSDIIFCRMNPSATANNWNNKWNQTADLKLTGNNNYYEIKAGTWDKGGGTWSHKCIEITTVTEPDCTHGGYTQPQGAHRCYSGSYVHAPIVP